LGIWAAARPRSSIDFLTTATIAGFLATPELVLALALLGFAVRTRLFPAGGMTAMLPPVFSFGTKIFDVLRHLVLPALCLAAGIFPVIASHVRVAVSETLQSHYVMAARAYGVPYRRVVLKHALPVAANPLISLVGLSVGTLLSSSLVVEAVFSWPGLGQLMLEAIFQRDMFLVLDSTMFGIILLIAGNLIADVLLYAADPRIRVE
jgi:peptide/nickel transport system permease protein